ncbi:hypothetical protein GCM10025879_19950 [Leuconostoc litchii]|nr:hypothetical protein GCM10025879_19950 [Leuconostoc litchii]
MINQKGNKRENFLKNINPLNLYRNQLDIANKRSLLGISLMTLVTILMLCLGTFYIATDASLSVKEKTEIINSKIHFLSSPHFTIASLWAVGMFFSASVQLFFYVRNLIINVKIKKIIEIISVYVILIVCSLNFDYEHFYFVSHDFTMFFLISFLYLLIYLWSVIMVMLLELLFS